MLTVCVYSVMCQQLHFSKFLHPKPSDVSPS